MPTKSNIIRSSFEFRDLVIDVRLKFKYMNALFFLLNFEKLGVIEGSYFMIKYGTFG